MTAAQRLATNGIPTSPDTHDDDIAVINPITGALVGRVPNTPPEAVQAAVERARQAQKAWAARSIQERGAVLRRWGDMLWADRHNAMKILRSETGKVDTGAYLEVMAVGLTLDYYVPNAPRILSPKRRTPLFPGIQYGTVYYRPYGVVGMISPWNYPLYLALTDAIPALLAGNTVVFKPSELTPHILLYAVDLMHRAGVPQDVAQVVTGAGATGGALVEHVDYIAFTGSTATGRRVAMRAAERLIPFSLEMGGKSPMIVLADADLERAATGVFVGGVENAGQMCISIERIYVEAPIYDAFVDRVKAHAARLTIGAGDGFDVHVGSMTTERELLRSERHIADALAKGATLLSGGRRRPDLGPLFFEPAILVNVDHTMDVMREETFGPVLPIMKVRDVEEALRLANDSIYGLSSTVWTRDLRRGEQLAARIEAGDVGINRAALQTGSMRMPWGGRKQSGMGRRNGPEGLLRYVTPQSVIVDRMILSKPSLTLLDPLTHTGLLLMRRVRRVLPFV